MTAVAVLVADVAAAVLFAPIAAVVMPESRQAVRVAVMAILAWTLASLVFVVTAIGVSLAIALTAHAVLLAAVLAAAALGRVLRHACRDPLDAIGVALGVMAALSFGIFAIGRFAGELSSPVLNALLAVNPIVATTAAATLDLFRTEWLYQVSPIPHRLFSYPSWTTSTGIFLAAAAAGAAMARWHGRRADTRPA